MQFINKDQVKIIHTLIAKMGLPDDDYRAILSGYKARSCKDLSFEDAKDLVSQLSKIAEKKGVYVKSENKQVRFASLGNRADMAYPSQLRKIEAMWCAVSRMPTSREKREALNSFLLKRFKIERLEWLPRDMVGKVIKSISSIKKVDHAS